MLMLMLSLMLTCVALSVVVDPRIVFALAFDVHVGFVCVVDDVGGVDVDVVVGVGGRVDNGGVVLVGVIVIVSNMDGNVDVYVVGVAIDDD